MEKPTQPKSLYDSSAWEISYKNFLAGFMRGLGGFLITLVTWGSLYYISVTYLVPQLSGFISEAKGMIQSAEKLQQSATNLMAPRSQSATPGSEAGTPTGSLMVTPELIKQVQQLQQK